MKTFLLTTSYFIFLAIANAQTPIAHYPFNGNANDAAGSNNGIVNGATLTTDRFSSSSYAYSFNGSSSNINIPDAPAFNFTSGITLSAWIFPTAYNTTYPTIIAKHNSLSSFELDIKNDNTIEWSCFIGGVQRVLNGGSIALNQWIHITATYNGSHMKIYQNGIEVAALATSGNIGTNSFPVEIGTRSGGGAHFTGKIDDVKIYNTALSSTQIKTESGFLPGSGKAINFTGTHYMYKSCITGINDFATNQDFTVECWIKAPVTQANTAPLVNSIITNIDGNHINYDMYIFNQPYPSQGAVVGSISIQRYDGSNNPYVVSSIPINDNKWHHCAFVRSGGTSGSISLYIDGVLQGTVADNTGNALAGYLMKVGGVGTNGYGNFTGNMDELRIWNIGLTAAQLRERMCRKIKPNDALWNNLMVNYNFDEDDVAGTATTGTIVNTSTNAEALNASFQVLTVPHVTSGAPVGNASSFNYSANPSATLTHPQGESLQATATSGTPAGIHVYSVNEKPNSTSGATNVGNNDRYFGVHVVGGSSPQYDVVYNYNGNPNVTAANENNLLLFKRDNNADISWENCGAALNTTANTLTATGQNTEYLLGGGFTTLPVSLLYFEAYKQNDNAILKWSTSFEQNNKGFEVLHSTDGINFSTIGFVNGIGNSSIQKNYSFTHNNTTKGKNYYRLKQVDISNRNIFSKTLLLQFDEIAFIRIYPNPVINNLTIQATKKVVQLALFDAKGNKLWQQMNNSHRIHKINTNQYAKGLLLLQIIDNNGESTIHRIIKQ